MTERTTILEDEVSDIFLRDVIARGIRNGNATWEGCELKKCLPRCVVEIRQPGQTYNCEQQTQHMVRAIETAMKEEI